eukprot:2181008-Amphidinium_carterae.2
MQLKGACNLSSAMCTSGWDHLVESAAGCNSVANNPSAVIRHLQEARHSLHRGIANAWRRR